MIDYIGDPNPGRGRTMLKFKKDTVIDVIQKEQEWWKGRTEGNEGWFPQQFVQELRQVCIIPFPAYKKYAADDFEKIYALIYGKIS